MTEENEVPTAPETQNPAPEATQDPANVAQESTAPDEAAKPEETAPEKTAEQKELERLRRQLTKAQRANGRLSQETQQFREQQRQPAEDMPAGDVNPLEIARELVKIERVTDKANGIAKAGEQAYGKAEFREAVQAVNDEAGPMFDQHGRPTALGDAILDSDDSKALIWHLHQNPELAAELADLTPAQLGRRLGRIEAQMGTKPQPKPVSKAPAPARPIGATRSSGNLADMDMDAYVQARKAQGARWAR